MKKAILILTVLLGNLNSFSQTINGIVTNSEEKSAISFVSIGVVGKDIGTVSDIDGTYHLTIGSEYDEEILRFSYIGFESYEVKVKEFRKATTHDVKLKPIIYELQEVVVTPNILGTKTLGHTGNSKMTTAGFGEYKLGFEHAIRMKLAKKEKAVVENIHLNIARCTFDSLHYRVNIYSITGKKNIKSVLKKPIYVKFTKEEIKDRISFNLEDENIVVTGDFLVSLEHIKDLGRGEVAWSSEKKKKTYVRKTSQGKWEIVKVGISISADVAIIK